MQGQPGVFGTPGKRVLMIYNHREVHIKTLSHYLESFYRHSKHQYSYVSCFSNCDFDLDYFDAVAIHYSVRMCYAGYLSRSFAKALTKYQGLKVLFVQDDYDSTNVMHQAILDLGIKLVFSCMPGEAMQKVYPPEKFPGVRFVHILVGYVPLELGNVPAKPMNQRSTLIGYRGRDMPFNYGDLGQEKLTIGKRMKEICKERGIAADIAWEEKDRIYGNRWFEFLGSCKATLGTESGSNVFDFDGRLIVDIRRDVQKNPKISYEEIREKYLKGKDGVIKQNQVSPKIFEAIALRTALVLFEGTYSDVVKPHEHFIPLKKDYSNVDEVFAKLQDDAYLEALTTRAYDHVIRSGNYSYEVLVRTVDQALEQSFRPNPTPTPVWLPLPPSDAVAAFRKSYQKTFETHWLRRLYQSSPNFLKSVVNREKLKRAWIALPEPLRKLMRPIFSRMRLFLYPN